ncbi:hypothetical protein [Roseibacillus persicicus]|uniref:Uncharacterized protein n=2 Tax=Roseibacillus persicicus TaxID=454148 RepID=A0A918TY11_9BACT|nr:hypothetical protein [Roseibacillus persicicus]GHC68278.1 hypothetical protein GCM10007100_40400 [Roseibacillus persicicus]
MAVLPPKIVQRDKAHKFLSDLANEEGKSEYVELQKAIKVQLKAAPTFLIFGTWMMHFLSRENLWLGLFLGGTILALGVFGMAKIQRLVGLLELFSPDLNTDP